MRATSIEVEARQNPTRTLIDAYLEEQQRLHTPVRRYADAHDAGALPVDRPWRDLIPLSRPAAGEQYAFEVDLDRCTGCKACVAGCHTLNGLDQGETWRDVGLLVGGTRSAPYQQTVTTACHHCADPACLNGCPVLAYEKDPQTGIVRHLDDQCIGCQYCVLKCPYDVPKYNARLGIVRKCDLCHSRLAAGEAPACVQACPTQAIRVVLVGTDEPAQAANTFLPGAPDPAYTRPATRYVTDRAVPPDVRAADADVLQTQPAHVPLVVMLTFLSLAVGCSSAVALTQPNPALSAVAALAAGGGIAASIAHLGQPLRAWRVFLGLRRSWLSREAVAFGLWLPLVATVALLHTSAARALIPSAPQALSLLSPAAAALGLLALSCSALIYVDTRRTFWRAAQTFPRFFGSAVILGACTAFVAHRAPEWASAAAAALLMKLALETRVLRCLDQDEPLITAEGKTAALLAGPLRTLMALRYASAFLVLVTLLVAVRLALPAAAAAACLFALFSEGMERLLFFRAVVAPKMPGVPS